MYAYVLFTCAHGEFDTCPIWDISIASFGQRSSKHSGVKVDFFSQEGQGGISVMVWYFSIFYNRIHLP